MISKSSSPTMTKRIAARFVKKLSPGDWVGLTGELGSGKTTFVQGMAEGLGISPRLVTSPTFTLVNDYKNLIHVDLYRIEDPREIETLGLEDYWNKIVVIEWVEKLNRVGAQFIAPTDHQVRFKIVSDQEREIEII